jgi:hypothetical protein
VLNNGEVVFPFSHRLTRSGNPFRDVGKIGERLEKSRN